MDDEYIPGRDTKSNHKPASARPASCVILPDKRSAFPHSGSSQVLCRGDSIRFRALVLQVVLFTGCRQTIKAHESRAELLCLPFLIPHHTLTTACTAPTTSATMPSRHSSTGHQPMSPPLSPSEHSPYFYSTRYDRAPAMPYVPLPPCDDHVHPPPPMRMSPQCMSRLSLSSMS